ncbi:TPA: type II secretion system protein, partial [Raoultella planticola]
RNDFFLKRNCQGFTLVELILTLAVIAAISFISFQSMNRDFEEKQAASIGEQIRNVGAGVNNYIVNHYDVLSKLENSTGGPQDPGSRTCSTATSTCEITTQTLVNEGMLPPVFNGKNIYGSGYKIIIARKGSAPYWNISALVATDTPLSRSGSIRYDLLGKAMKAAGIDSGMTRTSSTKVEGYKGSWSATQTEYSNIKK